VNAPCASPLEADSDLALLFVAAQFARDGDLSPLASLPAKCQPVPRTRRKDATSVRDSHPPTSFFHGVFVPRDNREHGSIPATVSTPLVATRSDGGGRPGAAMKSDGASVVGLGSIARRLGVSLFNKS